MVRAATQRQPDLIQWAPRISGNLLETTMKLTDTQLVVLSAAAARSDGSIHPLPPHLKGGAVAKVCDALLAKGLAAETDAGAAKVLVITDFAREALGIEPEPTIQPQALLPAIVAELKPRRTGTKQAQLIAMLETPEGASIEEIIAAFGWQPHTVRGAIAGALKKKLGLQIVSDTLEGRGRVYRIVA